MNTFGYTKSQEKIEIKEDLVKAQTIKEGEVKEATLGQVWLHETLDFLKPEKIRDAQKRYGFILSCVRVLYLLKY